jgi:hypothetical protein
MYAVYVGLNQWAVQRAQGASGRSWRPSGEERYARTRPALQSQVELGPRCARCCAASTKWGFDDERLLNLDKKHR